MQIVFSLPMSNRNTAKTQQRAAEGVLTVRWFHNPLEEEVRLNHRLFRHSLSLVQA
jgi:hypothetical protein